MKIKRFYTTAMAVMFILAGAGSLYALRPPHDNSQGITCGSCHKSGGKIRSFKPVCIDTCHNTSAANDSKRKALELQFASNIFGTFTNQASSKRFSHAWSTLPNYSATDGNNKRAGTNKYISINQTNVKGVTGTNMIMCSKCHFAHGASDYMLTQGTMNKPFVRASTKGDFICFQCHEERQISNVRDALPAGKAYSHPVEVNYSSARAKKVDLFEDSPTNPYPAANLPLYTTYGNVKGAVVCSTCHGPLHSSDSNPYTFDNMSLFSMGKYTTQNEGKLLRLYGKSKDVSNYLCKSCHKVTTHRSMNCYRCHTPHKRPGENNRYLILENISTPYNGKRPVLFTSTSEMAARFSSGYSTTASRLTRPVSNRICQVCHMNTRWHKNYSAVGLTGKNREAHATPNEYLGGGKYRNCTQCHEHGGGFSVGGAACGSCHGNTVESTPYPADTYGKHEKHVGKSTGASYGWSAGTLTDDRQATAYGFSCGRCHNPWTPYTASSVNAVRHAGTAPGSLKNYTVDFGFKNGTPLPQNMIATYTPGARGTVDSGVSGTDNYQFNTPSTGTCINLYCHGQFFGGYTGNNPVFNGANARQSCNGGTGRVCHGTNSTNLPGSPSETGTPVGAHRRHVGNSSNQYGQGTPNFRCNACHNATVGFNIQTSVTDKRFHVNGRVNVRFDAAYGDGSSKYDTFNDYSVSPNAAGTPRAYKTCGLIYCHSDGSRQGNYSAPFNAGMGSGTGRFPNWSSSKNFTSTLNFGGKTFKRRCSRCHGNSSYAGLTAAMPGVTSKGNSHAKHVYENGFACSVCHGRTVKGYATLSSVHMHVNQVYDIQIAAMYETSPGASSYSAGICSNVNCHGGKATPVWGNTATCQNCHMNTAGDVNKRIMPKSKFSEWTGAVPKIYSSSWIGSGHGRTGSAYPKSGNPAAGKDCNMCHGGGETRAGGLSTKHGTGNNPFRLLTAPDRPNFVCNRCHGVGGSGALRTGILTHMSSNTSTGPGSHNYEIKCIDCHDPHGDNNIFMIHSSVSRPNDATTAKDYASGRYGIITSNTTKAAVDFVNNVYTTDYAKKTAANRICQQCHNETYDPGNKTLTRYRNDGTTDVNHGSDKCTGCHTHSSGFKGAGCSNCHGNPPVTTATLIGGGDNPGEPASGSSTPGAHQKHIDALSGSASEKCSYCHQEGMYDSGAKNTDLEIGFKAFVRYTGSGQKYTGQTAVKNGFYGYSGTGIGTVDNNMRCNNMKCHGGGWLTKSFGTPTAPKWNDPNTATCGKCHGAKKAAGQGSWPTSKAHAKHAGTGNYGYDLPCKVCHTDTIVGNWTTLNDSVHVNAEAQVAFDTAGDQRVGAQSVYTAVGERSVNGTYGKCYTLYCHSRGTVRTGPAFDYANFTADWDVNGSGSLGSYKKSTPTAAKCNFCHGNRSWTGVTSAMPGYPNTTPKANRHDKHVRTYGFMCTRCHSGVVANNTSISSGGKSLHINRKYDLSFESFNSSDYGKTVTVNNTFAKYTLQTVTPFSKCKNTYCHSRGTDFTAPFDTRTSFANFTARWGDTPGSFRQAKGLKAKCNYCHGNLAYSGTTSAMPNYSTVKAKANSHRAHVISNGLGCHICHYGVARNNTSISDTTRHANRFYNISIAPGYASAGVKRYSSTWNTSGGTCMNIRCHGSGKPKWGSSLGCRNCHLTTTGGDKDNYANWSGFKGTGAQIYSSEWGEKGHGSKGKDCSNCHNKKVGSIDAHGTATNPYRLYTSDATALCLDCHGSTSERNKWNTGGFGNTTGYQTHSKANVIAGGHSANASWNNYSGQSVKCVDCHDPHGDKNKKMIHAQINYTGSDRFGRPVKGATAMMTFTTPVGTNWSSYAWGYDAAKSICRRCHTPNGQDAGMGDGTGNMTKASYAGTHQPHQPCSSCHAHKKGFAPSGCDTCHGNPPPPGPSSKNWFDSTTSLHAPHASNPRNRFINGSNGGTYVCNECHGNSGNGQGTGHSNWSTAVMQQMTSKHGEWSNGGTKGRVSVIDDTCWNVNCHTPRAYTRNWKRPVGCDGCHGYRKERGSQRAFNLQTTMSHKVHINWTATPTASWKKNYRFACSNCHYDWQTNNNYSTHYSGYVNMTAIGPVNTVGNMKIKQGQFYTRGRLFKGFTTGKEANSSFGTCSRAYCHGNFINGTALASPQWKKGVTTVNCGSCHKAKTAANGWSDGSAMPQAHAKHVGTAQYNFACARCHVRTVTNNTTVQFNWSSHVNMRKDVNFNTATTVDAGRKFAINNTYAKYTLQTVTPFSKCKNTYCHSRGTDRTAPFNTRTSFANFTARWGDNLASLGYKKPAGQKAKCNYCHGNRAYSGTTSAMPNYSGNIGYVKAKANSHRVHVVSNGIVCSICHNNIAMNNTSISDRTRHVNGFYNISIAPGKRGAGLKVYSMVYNGTGGTCMNNTCHGSSKPRWGDTTTTNCKACHLTSTGGDTDSNGTPNDSLTAQIYSSEWANKGHGKTSIGCTDCHNSGVAHNYAQSPLSNPFRLMTSRPDGLCLGCHGSVTERGASWNKTATNVDYKTHSKANTGGDASWNNFQGNAAKCVDCHDPHGDKNQKMIHSYINMTGSDIYGRPTNADLVTYNANARAQMTFTTVVGSNWSSYAWGYDAAKSICRRCHTPNTQDAAMGNQPSSPNQGKMTKTEYNGQHQSHGACTGCHNHKEGFKGGGEPAGSDNCDGCHSGLFNPMNGNASGYHHVMINTTGTYTNKTSFGTGDTNAKGRRCLMCHVRHKEFSPGVTAGRKRAANLRRSASAIHDNQTGINTDFWPAKRRRISGRTDGSANYSTTYPIKGPSGSYGVCISCHKNTQYKNTTLQENGQGQTARPFAISLYTSSSHNFQIISGMNKFSDGSRFRANCSKCHGSYYMNKTEGNQGREEFGLHDSKYLSVLRPMGNITGIVPPLGKNLCYRCHGTGARGSYDYYSSVKMNSGAKLIQSAVEAKTYGHPIGGNPESHNPDEYFYAAQGWNKGSARHIECPDCHNTHGGNATVERKVGSSTGNRVAGAQTGTWGVSLSYPGWTPNTKGTVYADKGKVPTFTKVAQVTYQYEVCMKCHTKFGFNTSIPAIPSGGPDPTPGVTTGGVAYDTIVSGIAESDVSRDFNPNNPGYHPVLAKGRNQPPHTANTAWTAIASGGGKVMEYVSPYTNRTAFKGTSGLGFTFVPPWDQKSLMGCSDCHAADNTGKAVAKIGAKTTSTQGNWDKTAQAATLYDNDMFYTTATGTATAGRADVSGSAFSGSASKVELAVYVKHSAGKAKNITVSVIKDGTTTVYSGGISTATSTDFTRYAVDITSDMTTAACLTYTCMENQLEVTYLSAFSPYPQLNMVAIEATYAFPEKLRGPHGSLQRWLLESANRDIHFKNPAATTYIAPNSSIVAGSDEEKIFCFNCHRRDVYVDGATYMTYSRMSHAGGNAGHANLKNPWGIWCMNCHGGRGSGQGETFEPNGGIHGIFATSTLWSGTNNNKFSGTAGQFKVAPRPLGVRLLYGSTSVPNLAGSGSTSNNIFCYTLTSTDAVGACTSEPGTLDGGTNWGATAGQNTPVNYVYTAW